MVSELNQTPRALRVHIGVFGDTNAGKSTFINADTGHEASLTSPVAGTTTDPVFKPMELLPVGPVVFIDTAGLDDKSELGKARVEKTMEQLKICDCAVLVVSSECTELSKQKEYIRLLEKRNIPVLIVVNKVGGKDPDFDMQISGIQTICTDIKSKEGVEAVKKALAGILADREEEPVLTGNLVKKGDLVLLAAPQDIQAPKGRLILPEVQVMRDLLDNGCMVMTVTAENLKKSLESLKIPPALVVTDSQIFREVNEIVPENVPLTSFSVLMAKIKGDINGFIKGAEAIDSLRSGDKVLILESCAHHALKDDIAREKIPALLRKYTGKNIETHVVSGQKVNAELSGYRLAIHCGGCMISRRAMICKQRMLEASGIPVTNFGIAIAYMNGILDRVCF
ncbi:MAG: [FeFe] hydrogenase H-cluster maturation GTPase HydF [Porcipelethomonas sp.]